MWSAIISDTGRRGVLRFALNRSSSPATWAQVLSGWRTDAGFRGWFNGILAGAPFAAFRWETPAMTKDTDHRAFEFVLLDSPGLATTPTPEAFGEHFDATPAGDILTFSNLGGDAILVVPRPLGPLSAYGHIGAFVRNAPEAQRLGLWQAVGEAMNDRLGAKPVWLSTAGGGIAWLHVRLDDRPKYYGFAPFRMSQ
jgi:hypothetical protein